LWSGPPFPSPVWGEAVKKRNPGSPIWLPRIGEGTILRFTGTKNSLDRAGSRWGPMRFVYIQHASDPMTFFSPRLLYRKPEWLEGERGPDVSPFFRWYPIVTFLQAGFDIPMATSVPTGYGHNFAPSTYIDAWIEVTSPNSWTVADTLRLKRHFGES
ncbi:MAG TPA: alpha/beta-hydrolase family protein, partial [Pirellulaceae bacterium]